ncbi:predicted protein [Plenodomus lingam JN3]|uniref:Predicted protein n=1 Tax=Leptosphaeria maculans (strain JN3 / isolate v23.1.3 / race Av1-4-5-6-7-8) TaxID=985895 RepID=E4ZTQ4_LEPMJ|nr:predicted protein [Plenodomus lingam JN3]CBX94614.1 predicted protein [Plenodomus lingam JN3]
MRWLDFDGRHYSLDFPLDRVFTKNQSRLPNALFQTHHRSQTLESLVGCTLHMAALLSSGQCGLQPALQPSIDAHLLVAHSTWRLF